VPCDLGGGVAQEIRRGEACPGALDRLRRHGALEKHEPRGLLCFAHDLVLIDGTFKAAPQRTFDALVELVEERGLPGVPQSWIRAAHIGAGEHIEIIQMRLIAT